MSYQSINPFEELNIDRKSLEPCLRIRKRERKKTVIRHVLDLLFRGYQFESHKSQSH